MTVVKSSAVRQRQQLKSKAGLKVPIINLQMQQQASLKNRLREGFNMARNYREYPNDSKRQYIVHVFMLSALCFGAMFFGVMYPNALLSKPAAYKANWRNLILPGVVLLVSFVYIWLGSNNTLRHASLFAFSFANGVLLTVMVKAINYKFMAYAFGGAALLLFGFALLSMFVLSSIDPSLNARFMSLAPVAVIILVLFNAFIPTPDRIAVNISLIIALLYIALDMGVMLDAYSAGRMDPVQHAFSFVLDFQLLLPIVMRFLKNRLRLRLR